MTDKAFDTDHAPQLTDADMAALRAALRGQALTASDPDFAPAALDV